MNTISTIEPPTFDPLSTVNFLRVDDLSKMPKFRQLVEIIKSDIKCGVFQIGEQIPSINETSAEFDVAKQTVERAYKVLKEKGILSAVKGKGYYVSSSGKFCSKRCLLLINNFNAGKKVFYQSLNEKMPQDSEINVQIFNGDPDQLERLIISNLGHYDYYIILPLVSHTTENLRKAVEMIPKDKLIFIHQQFENSILCPSIVQNCKNDIYKSLVGLKDDTRKYSRFHLVMLNKKYYTGILEGFTDYCENHAIPCDINPSMNNIKVTKGDLFIVKEEGDLINIIKQCNQLGYQLGQDVGIISYEESPYKEILAGGISTFTPDYRKMGQTLAQLIQNGSVKKTINGFKVLKRSSI